VLCILGLNFISNIVLAAGNARSGLSFLVLFVEAAIVVPLGMATVFFAYRGWAESAGRDKTIARVGAALLLVFCFVMILVFGGNVNGLTGLGASETFEKSSEK
jgi:hypothetical protein